MADTFLEFIASMMGWGYTAAWSLSFYPQPLLNYRRKSTSGTTIDFPFINALGMCSFHPLSPCLAPPPCPPSPRRPSPTSSERMKLNDIGFLAYLLSNWAFYYSPIVREQYALRHRGLPPTVQFNDIAFAAHALLLSLITTSQYCFPQWKFRVATPSPSRPILGLSLGCLLAVFLVALRVYYAPPTPDARGWCALDIAYAVSYV